MSQGMQRASALLLLLAVVCAVLFGAVVPVAEGFAERAERIETLSDAALRYERIAARADLVRAELAALPSADQPERGSFNEASVALAAATLQERLRELVAGAGGALGSTRVLPPREAGPFDEVGVEARLRLDIAGLQRVLHGLESGERLLRIDQLTVRSLNRSPLRAQAGTQVLDVQFQVVGFQRRQPAGS